MYQHPIPQNVTAYQFRLIGDMTIKQFLELAAGIILAILLYFSNLYAPLKFILIGASAVFGFVLAFVPIEERPLDQWVIAFIKAIYRPTQFVWRKNPQLPDYFNYTTTPQISTNATDEAIMTERKQAGLSSFIQTLPSDHFTNPVDKFENQQLSYLDQLFSSTTGAPVSQLTASTMPASTFDAATASEATASTTKPISVPINKPTPLEETPLDQVQQQPAEAMTSNQLPFLSTPSTPNTIVGLVLDQNNELVDNAVIEIRDHQGNPVRATKSNRLGQFFSSIPLNNGSYEIEIKKNDLQFSILRLQLGGEIIPPLEIRALTNQINN